MIHIKLGDGDGDVDGGEGDVDCGDCDVDGCWGW